MSFTQDLFTSRRNLDDGNTRIGDTDRIWYDSNRNAFYISDGVTEGGILIGTGGSNGNVSGNNYSNVNVAAYLSYTSTTGNLDLGNLYITDETIGGKIADRDITLSPAGAGLVATPGIKLSVGSVVQGVSNIIAVVTSTIISSVDDYSTGPSDNLSTGDYGLTNGVSGVSPGWTVYRAYGNVTFDNTIQVGDSFVGAGIPVNSTVVFVGNTSGTDPANANIIITSYTLNNLPPLTANTTVYTTRDVDNPGLAITTLGNTDITLNPGIGGNIVPASSIIPLVSSVYNLGTPTRRFKELWLGAGTIYVQDETLGTDQAIGAIDGNLYIAGGAGLTVGKFTLTGNTIALNNPNEDFYIGSTFANGNLRINRPLEVLNSSGNVTFSVTRSGRVEIDVPNVPANDPGALLINASTLGNYSPVYQAGGMLHIIGPDGYTGTAGQLGQSAKINVDAYGTNTNYGVLINARRSRGNVSTPAAVQTNDVLLRVVGSGFATFNYNDNVALGWTSIDMVATQTFTTNSFGSVTNIYAVPNNSNARVLSASFTGNGINVSTSGTGITFADGSFQNTAFYSSDRVRKITTGEGFLNPGNYQGNITLDTVDVHSLTSSSYSLTASNPSGNQYITLSLAQEIAPNSSPTFNNLTVGNLTVSNVFTTVTNASINGKILFLANNSTSASQIDGGGIILGNSLQSYNVSILYDLTNDRWDTDGAGLKTLEITAEEATFIGNIHSSGVLHLGYLLEQEHYSDAAIQADFNVNSFGQIVIINHNGGTNASADLVATNDIGDEDNNYIDVGINSSQYSSVDYPIMDKNSGYLFVQGNVTGAVPYGNLTIGTGGNNTVIKFHTSGFDTTDERVRISDTGLSTPLPITSTVATGTAPLVIASTTKVNNLYANRASYADRLNPGATINGTLFDGVTNIEIGANASLLTGTYLNSSVVGSSLTTVGNLINLNVTGNVTANYVRTTSHGIFNANVYTNYIVSSGRYLTELPSYAYSNANVNSYLSVTTASPGTQSLTLSNGAFTFTPANLAIYAWSSNVANANVAMKGYVDSQISTVTNNWTSANTIQSNQINAITANIANLQASSTGNIRYFGSFWDNTTVTQNANLAIINTVPIANTYGNLGVTIASGDRITFSANGSYKLDYSLQFQNSDNKTNQVAVWLRKNGSDIDQSSSYFSLPAQGSVNGYTCAVGPFIDGTIATGDYYQLMWVGLDRHISLQGIEAKTVPPVPAAPSTIVMVTRV